MQRKNQRTVDHISPRDSGGRSLSSPAQDTKGAGRKNTTSTSGMNLDETGLVGELHEALGVSSPELATTILIQMARASDVQGLADLRGCKSLAAALRGIGPKDELEAMLAAQMVTTHTLAMRFLGSTSPANFPNQVIDSNLNRGTRLLRCFLMQLDGLNRHRSKGQQKMVVEHVHVHNGGQAIVGPVTQPSHTRNDEAQN